MAREEHDNALGFQARLRGDNLKTNTELHFFTATARAIPIYFYQPPCSLSDVSVGSEKLDEGGTYGCATLENLDFALDF